MQCLFFIWRPGHHRSSKELQGLGKSVMARMGGSLLFKAEVPGSSPLSHLPKEFPCVLPGVHG